MSVPLTVFEQSQQNYFKADQMIAVCFAQEKYAAVLN